MKISKRIIAGIIVLCFTFPALSKNYEVRSAKKAEKETKRIAHRFSIPVEQLENARSALQEATELAITLDPFPTSRISSIVSQWNQLYPSRSEEVIEYFIIELEVRAQNAVDEKSYGEATSSAASIFRMLVSDNYRKARELLTTWPYPPESFGEAAIRAREGMQSVVTQVIMRQIAEENPEALSEQYFNSDSASPSDVMMIVSELDRSGNREKAKKLIDGTMQGLENNIDDPEKLSEYMNLCRNGLQYMDDSEVETVMDQLIPMMRRHADSNNPEMTLKKGDVELQISRTENVFINMLRSLTNRPRLLNRVLDKYPEFESKFDPFGGIDDYFSGGRNGTENTNYERQINTGSGPRVTIPDFISGFNIRTDESQELLNKLKNKAVDDPQYVKQELRNYVKDPDKINLLTSLASRSSREYPELAEIALEIAEELLPDIDNLKDRFSALQSVISAYRNLDGEVDEELFRKGFILVDRIREEQSLNTGENPPPLLSTAGADTSISTLLAYTRRRENADKLYAYLVAEIARGDYDTAINYVDTMPPGISKMECLLQISNVLCRNNF